MDTQYVKSVQQWLVDIGLLREAAEDWTPESLSALAGAAMVSSAVDPTNLTLLKYAPSGYRFIGSALLKCEEEIVETDTVSAEATVVSDSVLHIKKRHKN